MKGFIRFGVLFLMFACSSQATAQSAGDMVRVTTLLEDRFDGIVSEVYPNRIDLRLSDGSLKTLPHEDIAKLERNMGKRTYKKRGFLIGGVVGGAFGVASSLFGDDCGSLIEFNCDPEDKLIMTIITAGFTGSIGWLAGAFIKGDRWQEVPKPWAGRLQLSPMIKVSYREHTGQRIQVGLNVRF